MSLITLFNTDRTTIATDRLVFEPDEVSSLTDVVDQAERMRSLLEEEESRIEQATKKGHELGYENGQEKGYEAALEHIAVKLVLLTKEAQATRNALENNAADLAIQIVERIASDIGTQETIAALAKSAAADLVPREPVVLRVHPQNLTYMQDHVLQKDSNYACIIDVVSDYSLAEEDCVLETEFGQVKAGLKTQLKVLREKAIDHAN